MSDDRSIETVARRTIESMQREELERQQQQRYVASHALDFDREFDDECQQASDLLDALADELEYARDHATRNGIGMVNYRHVQAARTLRTNLQGALWRLRQANQEAN